MVNSIVRYRWIICGLVFFATTINYLDRVVISLLKSDLSKAFNWNEEESIINYANIEIAFKFSYAVGMLFAGKIIDKLGTKIGYAVATTLWSLASIFHAFVSGTLGFTYVRVFLGLTEAGNFPAAIKTTAEWFPKKERALATGIFNSGSSIGAIVAPLTVPFIALKWGWQWAFIITGTIGFIWLILWIMFYELPSKHKKLSKEEFDYITAEIEEVQEKATAETDTKLSWLQLLKFKQTWAFVIGKLLTDPIWWFYLFWLPDFLKKQYNVDGTNAALPIALVYLISAIGSIGGGWLPMYLIDKGQSVFKARKTSMLAYACLVFPILFAQLLGNINMWFGVIIIGIAAAAHQAWSANIFTTVSDMFPKQATASVTGIGGMFGALGGILLSVLVQKKLFVYYEKLGQIETAYYIMFIICGLAYISAWLIMHFLVPKFNKIKI